MRILVVFLLLALVSTVLSLTAQRSDIGLNDFKGRLVAFGDFDADRFTDLVAVGTDLSPVALFLWKDGTKKFEGVSTVINDTSVSRVYASDFNHDGRLDLIVQSSNPLVAGGAPGLSLYLRHSADVTFTFASALPATGNVLGAVTTDDLLVVDLFGADTSGKPTLWKNSIANTGGFTAMPFLNSSELVLLPHGEHAFVDIDGDCRADLAAMVCQQPLDAQGNCAAPAVSFWSRNSASAEYTHSLTVPLPAGSGQPVFADLDGDGTIDFAVMVPARAAVMLYYNEHLVSTSALCAEVPQPFDFPLALQRTVQIPGLMNVPMAITDCDRDGYPDILVVTASGPKLYISDFGLNFTVDPELQFAVDGESITAVNILDIGDETAVLLSIRSASGPDALLSYELVAGDDTFFVKLIGLNGVCPAWCSEGAQFPSPKPYGVNMPGIVFRIAVTDFDNKKHVFAVPQLPQLSRPQPPYCLFGLGARLGGYIDSVEMGVPKSGSHKATWSGVVPNAVLVAIPYPLESSADWPLLLFVSPAARSLAWVIVAVVVTLIISGTTAIVFKLRERALDAREQTMVGRVFF